MLIPIFILNEAISAIKFYCQNKADIYNIDMVFLYGSWASGILKKQSDVFEILTTISLELTDVLKKRTRSFLLIENYPNPCFIIMPLCMEYLSI